MIHHRSTLGSAQFLKRGNLPPEVTQNWEGIKMHENQMQALSSAFFLCKSEPKIPAVCLGLEIWLHLRLQHNWEILKLFINENSYWKQSDSDTAESAGLPRFLAGSRSPQGVLHCYSCTSPHMLSCSHPLTVIRYVRNLESFGTVPFIWLELDPQLLRPRSESYRAFVGLTGFIGGHRIGGSFQRKHTISSYLTVVHTN